MNTFTRRQVKVSPVVSQQETEDMLASKNGEQPQHRLVDCAGLSAGTTSLLRHVPALAEVGV